MRPVLELRDQDQKSLRIFEFPLLKTPMAKPKRPKTRSRYSIGEWYGVGFESMSPGERFLRSKKEYATDALLGLPCPFKNGFLCNKKGGVCSLRQYQQTGSGPVTGVGPIITTCPQRFFEANTIFRWVGETILQTDAPLVVGELGFLDRRRPDEDDDEEDDNRDFIGRIDSVLVHPSKTPIEWCALELQAVYFSGKSMRNEFAMMGNKEADALSFPAQHRRPDWRSSGPKRLLPQLQTKVPTIRTWGKKMAVVIDEAFFESLIGLEREKHLSNAEIVWFIVGYDAYQGNWRLVPREVVYTKLDASVDALTGGVPLSKERFEEELRRKLGRSAPVL